MEQFYSVWAFKAIIFNIGLYVNIPNASLLQMFC